MSCPAKFSNYVRKTLAANLSASATSIALSDVAGLPGIVSGEYFYLVFSRLSDAAYEVVKVTAVTSVTLTISRAQEGTTALAFTTGDRAELWLTAGGIDAVIAYFQGLYDAYTPAAGSITGSQLAAATVTVANLADALNLSGKTITMPVNRMPKIVAEGSLASTAPDYVGQMAVTTGSTSGRVLVGYGTSAGNWLPMEKVATSISSTPAYVGQWALVSGVFYVAKAASSSSDWVPLSLSGLFLSVQGSQLDSGVAGLHSVYVKTVSGNPHLFFAAQGGSEYDMTAALSNVPTAYNAPDWDSGWTKVSNGQEYDLTNTNFGRVAGGGTDEGGFSKTSGKDDATSGRGTTNANVAFGTPLTISANHTGWRFARVLFKPVNSAVPSAYSAYVVLPESWMLNYSGYYCGFFIGWTGSKPYIKTAANYVYVDPSGTNFGDWAAYAHATGLLRIQAWK